MTASDRLACRETETQKPDNHDVSTVVLKWNVRNGNIWLRIRSIFGSCNGNTWLPHKKESHHGTE